MCRTEATISSKITQNLWLLNLNHKAQFVIPPTLHVGLLGMQRLNLVFPRLETLGACHGAGAQVWLWMGHRGRSGVGQMETWCVKAGERGGSSGESFMAGEGFTEQCQREHRSHLRHVPPGPGRKTPRFPPIWCWANIRSIQLEWSTSSGKGNKAAPNKWETPHPHAPTCHLPSSSPKQGKAGRISRVNSLVKAEGTEGRLCLQESCQHCSPWCLYFLEHP